MSIYKLDPDPSQSFDFFSPQLGYQVTVLIYPPTDERLEGSLRFIDLNQVFPLLPYIEQAAKEYAHGEPNKTQEYINTALAWLEGQSQSRREKDAGMEVLNAAFHARLKAFTSWQRETLMPLVDKGEIAKGISEAVSTALSNFDRIKCEEIAAMAGHTLKTSLITPEGTYKTKKVRGRPVSVFKSKANLGRAKGSKNTKPTVTYERIVREIKRYKGNAYGNVPTEKGLALKLNCTQRTIKNCLLEKGERRRFSDFVRVILDCTSRLLS